jgi:hypothetical protein
VSAQDARVVAVLVATAVILACFAAEVRGWRA